MFGKGTDTYPIPPVALEAIMKRPRERRRSDDHEEIVMMRDVTAYGGTVRSWARALAAECH